VVVCPVAFLRAFGYVVPALRNPALANTASFQIHKTKLCFWAVAIALGVGSCAAGQPEMTGAVLLAAARTSGVGCPVADLKALLYVVPTLWKLAYANTAVASKTTTDLYCGAERAVALRVGAARQPEMTSAILPTKARASRIVRRITFLRYLIHHTIAAERLGASAIRQTFTRTRDIIRWVTLLPRHVHHTIAAVLQDRHKQEFLFDRQEIIRAELVQDPNVTHLGLPTLDLVAHQVVDRIDDRRNNLVMRLLDRGAKKLRFPDLNHVASRSELIHYDGCLVL
jgi:hypothetical protein